MTIGDRIKERREVVNISQTELAEKAGISKQTLYKYENNIIANIPSDKVEKIASILDTTPAYLMGWDINVVPIKNGTKHKKRGLTINVLGRVAAGTPIEAIEEIIDTEDISAELSETGEFFGLQIHGDSMEPKMSEGDVVIVRQQDYAESGDIVIAMINGEDATCKRLRKYRDGIELISTNPSYGPMFFSNEDIVNKPVKIIGKVVELRAKF